MLIIHFIQHRKCNILYNLSKLMLCLRFFVCCAALHNICVEFNVPAEDLEVQFDEQNFPAEDNETGLTYRARFIRDHFT